jgi:hypothetical protein
MTAPPRDHPEFCFLKSGMENSISDPPPLPAFLLKSRNMPAYKRRHELSVFVQILMPIILATAILAIGVAIGSYWLFAY